MHDKFLNQKHGTFFFIAILDGIFFLLLRYNNMQGAIANVVVGALKFDVQSCLDKSGTILFFEGNVG
jgi:hypothetical protein